MLKQQKLLIGFISCIAAIALFYVPQAFAQNNLTNLSGERFQGRGVAQGAVFSRGQNAEVSLTLDGENFGLEMSQFQGATGTQNRSPARIQYRGVVSRRTDEPNNASSFTLNTRVRSFDSSETLRVITNTTGSCRIVVFGARINYINCTTLTDNSSTRFLGLEQF
ncbi:hypothetical protein [Leptolyngbya iicbica]|uniref:Uncharacterized protein n=2 Tax=Cyanophyceae TaxID=3028117 RepID=A0A4Q7E4W6_9CYAN|nr:hypothetical protein [Leptolyngbya sp. LK]RZM76659.1 hypothetical protein DYY88_18560 [Leptolyngbya sp. LK]